MPDVEQPADASELSGAVQRPRSASLKEARKRCSVFFNPADLEQNDPALPVRELVEHLRTRHGNTPYAGEFINAVEDADANGDGLINIPELILVIEGMHNLKNKNTKLKSLLMVAFLILIVVLIAIFGLVFAVVELTKEISTGGDDSQHPNALVSKTTGIIVDTHPSDGGGIFLDMVAFTEPLNITFPGFDDTPTLECVGHIAAASIEEHYTQFTVGGSSMTIRYIDYSRPKQPITYTHIPGSNVEVSGFAESNNAGLAASEFTQAMKNTQAAFGDNRRQLGRELNYILNPKDPAAVEAKKEEEDERQRRNLAPPGSSTITSSSGKSNQATKNKSRRRRRMQEEEGEEQLQTVLEDDGDEGVEEEIQLELETVDDYMKSFASQENDITFLRDIEISQDYYFVCLASGGTTATN